MILDNWLAQRAQTNPDRVALIDGDLALTYAELEPEAARAARRLGARGARGGATVALVRPAGAEYVVLLHALMKLGAVAHPLNPALAPAELEAELARARPGLVLRADERLTTAEADLPLLGEHDLEALNCRILTSGTSGRPRAVGLTYGNHLWSAVGSAFNLGVDPEDRWLCCLPLHHVAGLEIVLRSVIYGTGAIVHDGFDPARVEDSLERQGVTLISLVTTQLTRLLEAGVELSGPRAILVGGGPVPLEVLEEAVARGARVVQTYGLTETASQVTTLSPHDAKRKLGSAGRPLLTTHSRGRWWRRAAPTRTGGCTPGTWGGSTTRASSTSRAGSAI
jgi:O-succinylbenzoic acid--CoA ligase